MPFDDSIHLTRINSDSIKTIKKILICQQRQIGDVLLATPVLELLKKRFPDAEIDFFTEKKCVPILENNPNIHKIHALDKKKLKHFFAALFYYYGIARNNYDLIVDLQQLPRIRWINRFSRQAIRLTFTPPWYRRLLYTDWVDIQKGYAVAEKVSILRVFDIIWQGEIPRIYLKDSEIQDVDVYLKSLGLKDNTTLITVDSTHRRITRRWPAEYYAKLMVLIAKKSPNMVFLPLFGPGEEKDIRELIEHCEKLEPGFSKENLLITDRMLTLREMAACIAKAKVHIGNCSSPRHIAVAVDTPSFIVLGSNSGWTFPSIKHTDVSKGLACQPCHSNVCPINCKCLYDLAPEEVISAFWEHLENNNISL